MQPAPHSQELSPGSFTISTDSSHLKQLHRSHLNDGSGAGRPPTVQAWDCVCVCVCREGGLETFPPLINRTVPSAAQAQYKLLQRGQHVRRKNAHSPGLHLCNSIFSDSILARKFGPDGPRGGLGSASTSFSLPQPGGRVASPLDGASEAHFPRFLKVNG